MNINKKNHLSHRMNEFQSNNSSKTKKKALRDTRVMRRVEQSRGEEKFFVNQY